MAPKCFYYNECGNELADIRNIFQQYKDNDPNSGMGVVVCGSCMQKRDPKGYEKQKKEMEDTEMRVIEQEYDNRKKADPTLTPERFFKGDVKKK